MPFLRPAHRLLSLVVFVGVPLAACGGATDTGLFDSPGTTSTTEDAGTKTTPVTDAGGATAHDSGTTTPIHDAAPPVTVDANPPAVDSAPPPPTATIDCAVSNTVKTCDAATQVCCRTSAGGFGSTNYTYACTTAAGCDPQQGLSIPCDNNDDCAAQGFPSGTVCCVTADATSGASSVECVDSSACTAANGQAPLCNDNGACPDPTEPCTASTHTLPGYKICE